MTPFEAVYGRSPPTLIDYVDGDSTVAAVDELLVTRTQLIQQLKDNLQRAQLRMCQQANKHRSDVEYRVGDWVFVKLQPYRQSSLRGRRSPKLAKRYYGPFEITERIGKVAYRLQLPDHNKIHDVFHVSLLKQCRGNPPLEVPPWPESFTGNKPVDQPLKALRRRMIQRNGQTVSQVMVQWQGQKEEEATWEDSEVFKQEFPDCNVEVAVLNDGGSDVTPRQPEGTSKVTRDKGEEQARGRRIREPSRRYSSEEYVTGKPEQMRGRKVSEGKDERAATNG